MDGESTGVSPTGSEATTDPYSAAVLSTCVVCSFQQALLGADDVLVTYADVVIARSFARCTSRFVLFDSICYHMAVVFRFSLGRLGKT